MTYHIAFQIDPLETLKPAGDSSLALMRAAAERGHRLFCYQPERLSLSTAPYQVMATGQWVQRDDAAPCGFRSQKTETVDLAGMDVVWIRQDPPFDLAYITATHVLDHLARTVLVVNDPAAVRNAPEKLLVTHFPTLTPPTLITRDTEAVRAFLETQRDIVLKPLYMYGGRQVVRVKADDQSLDGLLELYFAQNREPIIAQTFLPAVKNGDKRIILIDGQPVACFRRVPAEGDFRANMRVGGQPVACMITPEDQRITDVIGPVLRDQGLLFVGIDVIGTQLTEINVTSPTGLMQANALLNLDGRRRLEHKIWDALDEKLAARKLA